MGDKTKIWNNLWYVSSKDLRIEESNGNFKIILLDQTEPLQPVFDRESQVLNDVMRWC